MLLYVHVPFCRQKCHYCAFHSVPLCGGNEQGLMDQYHKTLLQEMQLWAEKLKGGYEGEKKPITSIFFGGGTPSLLKPNHIGSIIDTATKYFQLDANAEITMEANPDSLGNKARCKDFLYASVNRLSLGIQSLDDSLLKIVGRRHNANQAVLAYATARHAGFENINLDFMWGLPQQTSTQWLEQVRAIIEMGPEHVSAYGLTLEDGTHLKAMCEKNDTKLVLASDSEQETMFLQGSELLRSAGYEHYEISNFAQEDCQCRHNLGYWSGEEYLGLGPAAVSALYDVKMTEKKTGQKVGERRTNPYDHKTWAQGVETGGIEYGKYWGEIENLPHHIMVEEYMMLALRTSRGIMFSEYTARTGYDFMAQHKDLVHALCSQGLAILNAQHFALTTQGMLASNDIMERFF